MLHSQVLGAGPPLVLLHGLFGAGENLRVIAKALADHREVHMVDLPNHGQSPHLNTSDYLAMSDAVDEYLRSLDGPTAVIGHSMGGKVAMCSALRSPELVTHLIVLDIAPRRYSPSHREIIKALRSLALADLESRGDAETRLSQSIPSRPVRSFLLKNLIQDDEGFRWKLNLPVLDSDYEKILGWPADQLQNLTFAGPTQFVAGARSDYLKPERDRDEINRWFTDADIAVIANAGHWIHSDAPEQVIERVDRVLGRA